MSRVVVVALLAIASCRFAANHPAITIGVVGTTVGFGTCELSTDAHGTCALIAGTAGAGLALIVAGAMWLGGRADDEPPELHELEPEPPLPLVDAAPAPPLADAARPTDAGAALDAGFAPSRDAAR